MRQDMVNTTKYTWEDITCIDEISMTNITMTSGFTLRTITVTNTFFTNPNLMPALFTLAPILQTKNLALRQQGLRFMPKSPISVDIDISMILILIFSRNGFMTLRINRKRDCQTICLKIESYLLNLNMCWGI